jgi:membrane protease subunit HflK
VGLCAQAAARELVATRTLDELLTSGRGDLETRLAAALQGRLDRLGAGVQVVSAHVVDLHPPQEAVFAFRDVSSAREDRDRRIQSALAEGEKEVPQARGNGALAVAEAQAAADSARAVAAGRSEGFLARAAAFAGHRDILRDLLWLETEEKVLPGRRKYIVPPGAAGRRLVLWPDQPPAPATLPPGFAGEGE